jgi:dTDP-4-dehydrorhamnose 3,5-epimerase
MNVVHTGLEGLLVLEPRVFRDDRGFFVETWNRRTFEDTVGCDVEFVQDNHSRSTRGVLRGLHYQRAPHAQGKLVRVVRGAIFDVAVDLRRGSTTLGRWVGVELSDENQRQLWVPEGFAHGFVVLSDVADVAYKTTDYYAPAAEECIRWDDPELGIAWPVVSGTPPRVSQKDERGRPFRDAPRFD